jgi:Protein of unknown function (DUF3572)
MARPPETTRESAEMLAIQALSFIAEEPERLGRFLAITGLEAQSLRDAAREPNFLLGVLDHLVGDERLLTEFATQHALTPEAVTRARDLLAGARPATP